MQSPSRFRLRQDADPPFNFKFVCGFLELSHHTPKEREPAIWRYSFKEIQGAPDERVEALCFQNGVFDASIGEGLVETERVKRRLVRM